MQINSANNIQTESLEQLFIKLGNIYTLGNTQIITQWVLPSGYIGTIRTNDDLVLVEIKFKWWMDSKKQIIWQF